MISGVSLLVNVACYASALSITLLSAFYTYRQRLTSYQITRHFLMVVYIVIMVLMVVDLVRIVAPNAALVSVYPVLSFGIGFVEAILLLSAAVGIYLRQAESTYTLLLRDIASRPLHFLVFMLFVATTVGADVFLAVARPYRAVTVVDFAGGTAPAVSYATSFSVGIGIIFLFFLAYPVALLAVGGLRARNPDMRRAQLGLAAAFAGSSAIYLVSSVSLFDFGMDYTGVAYVVLAVFFGFAARNFRNAALFAGFVLPVAKAQEAPEVLVPRTVGVDGLPVRLVPGAMGLVEVDTSARYEDGLGDLVADLRADKRSVFVVSARGSRLHAFFSRVPGVRLYTMSEATRYIAPVPGKADEVMIPLYDSGVLQEILDRTIASAGERVAIVFDSVSDMMMYSGFESCYKFLKAAGEIVSGGDAVTLFVVFAGAHDERNVMAVKSLFSSQLRIGARGVEVVR